MRSRTLLLGPAETLASTARAPPSPTRGVDSPPASRTRRQLGTLEVMAEYASSPGDGSTSLGPETRRAWSRAESRFNDDTKKWLAKLYEKVERRSWTSPSFQLPEIWISTYDRSRQLDRPCLIGSEQGPKSLPICLGKRLAFHRFQRDFLREQDIADNEVALRSEAPP